MTTIDISVFASGSDTTDFEYVRMIKGSQVMGFNTEIYSTIRNLLRVLEKLFRQILESINAIL